MKFENLIISETATAKEALERLNDLADKTVSLFVADAEKKITGSLTDGDIRRGFLQELKVTDVVSKFMNRSFNFISGENISQEQLSHFKKNALRFVPQLDAQHRLVKVVDVSLLKAILPVDVVIMAGGRGERLKPLTDNTPKPLLEIGGKPIIERNIDRLASFGVKNFFLSVNYLAEQIEKYFGDGAAKNISMNYVHESNPLGTIGAAGTITDFKNEFVLVLNSDLLTNIDFEEFFLQFKNQNADFSIATIPYNVNVPYAILELSDKSQIMSLKEKPTYTYFANAGIYLVKKNLLQLIPQGKKFDATDLIELLIQENKKVVSFPILSYWLDIGNMDDYRRAQMDVLHLNF